MEEIADVSVFQAPANWIITGAMGSGKTQFLLHSLKHWPFSKKLGTILYFYSEWQSLFKTFLNEFPNKKKFVQGLQMNVIKDGSNLSNRPDTYDIYIFDDLAELCTKNEIFAKCFTVLGSRYVISFSLRIHIIKYSELHKQSSKNYSYIFRGLIKLQLTETLTWWFSPDLLTST